MSIFLTSHKPRILLACFLILGAELNTALTWSCSSIVGGQDSKIVAYSLDPPSTLRLKPAGTFHAKIPPHEGSRIEYYSLGRQYIVETLAFSSPIWKMCPRSATICLYIELRISNDSLETKLLEAVH